MTLTGISTGSAQISTLSDAGLHDIPALAIEQYPNLPVSVPHAGLSDLSDAHPQGGAWIFITAIPKGSPMQPGHSACPPLAHLVAVLQILDELPAPRGPYSFFESTSCSMTLSRVKSATNRFSRPFSSSSCLS